MKIARGYFTSGGTLDDLIQEGNHGLIEAAERFDPESHETQFSTYAIYWIRNKIRRSIAANRCLIRQPACRMRVRDRNCPVVSGSSASLVDEQGQESNLEETIADKKDYIQAIETAENHDKLHRAIARLTPLEAWLIRRRFGFDEPPKRSRRKTKHAGTAANPSPCRQSWTHDQLADALGISRHRIRQIEHCALGKLRESFAEGEE